MWKIITKSGRPLTYEGAAVLFPDADTAEDYMSEGDLLQKVGPTRCQLRQAEIRQQLEKECGSAAGRSDLDSTLPLAPGAA